MTETDDDWSMGTVRDRAACTRPFSAMLRDRLDRRTVLKGLAGTGVAAAAGPLGVLGGCAEAEPAADGALTFVEIEHGVDGTDHVSPGYSRTVLLRWGDPVLPGAAPFDPEAQTAAKQLTQFGYNNDYIGYFPLPRGSVRSGRGLLCVNHEFTDRRMMFPGVAAAMSEQNPYAGMTKALVDVEMAAHGMSIVEVRRADGAWRVVPDSPYARRISMLATEMTIAGPAAGSDRMKTADDPTGRRVTGMLNNCAGGETPWGTVLTGEENFHFYFRQPRDADTAEAASHAAYGIGPVSYFAWFLHHERFNTDRHPNEPNRFGWVVEIDPYDATSVPKKRTALGRFAHEGAQTIVNHDGRVVVYMGDDKHFEYLYRFVSARAYDPEDRDANADLLDDGVLSVARFEPDGTLRWLPLLFGEGPLGPENGFHSQADVLIETRRAADLLGATPMDRPEDVEPNPVTGTVYMTCTNNSKREPEEADAANPRGPNYWGHIIEVIPPHRNGRSVPEGDEIGFGADSDHAAETCRWEILIACGDPGVPAIKASYHANVSPNGWFTSPDNLAVDPKGRLWIATDQGRGWPKITGMADGLYACAVEGNQRALTRMFYRTPVGAELCGPCFTPDGETLFLAVQHPSSDSTEAYEPFGRPSSFEDPATRWPDFDESMPPRPSVVAITRDDGGPIGG